MQKWLRIFAPAQTPEDYFRLAFQRELTAEEKHLLGLAAIALEDCPFEPEWPLEMTQILPGATASNPVLSFPLASPESPMKRDRRRKAK